MLIENFRKNSNRWFVAGVVGFMCLVFVFVGVFPTATNMITGGNNVATVDGEPISITEFQRVLGREMEAYKAFGDQLPPFFMAQIQERALQGLIQQRLLLLEAKRQGVYVSNQEVMKEIQGQPFFQNEETKKFDVERYKQVLQSNALTPGGYEAMIQEDLMRQKLVNFFQSRVRVSEEEVKREFELAADKRNLEYLRVRNEDAYAKMSVTKDQIDAFLADAAKKPAIDNHYNANIRKYKKDEEVCARHILKREELAKEGETAKPADPAEKAPKAFLALNPSKSNFEDLAKKNSDDPGSKVKGGDLGCFPRGMMDDAFEKVAFSLPIGKVSEPVKSAFGWHYILVYEKKAGFEKKVDLVGREIAEELLKKEQFAEVQKINRASAEDFAKRWTAGERKGLAFTETGLFSRVQSTIPTIGKSNEILNAAFDEKAAIQSKPQIFEAAGGIIVAKVKGKETPDMTKFAEERPKQLKTLQARKLEAFFPAWMENVQSHFPVKTNPQVMARFQEATATQ
jgi:peptidyl-prolyl cis-trans isomerase D